MQSVNGRHPLILLVATFLYQCSPRRLAHGLGMVTSSPGEASTSHPLWGLCRHAPLERVCLGLDGVCSMAALCLALKPVRLVALRLHDLFLDEANGLRAWDARAREGSGSEGAPPDALGQRHRAAGTKAQAARLGSAARAPIPWLRANALVEQQELSSGGDVGRLESLTATAAGVAAC